jgi:hypothetical protein
MRTDDTHGERQDEHGYLFSSFLFIFIKSRLTPQKNAANPKGILR